MEQDQEKVVERSSSGRSKWIVLLVIAVIVLVAGCVLLFVWKSKEKEEDDGGKIGYDTNAVVVTDEDELQKLADEMNKNDGEISLEYKNVATSQDGSNFNTGALKGTETTKSVFAYLQIALGDSVTSDKYDAKAANQLIFGTKATTKKAMVKLDASTGTNKKATYKIFGDVATKPAKAWVDGDTVDFKIVYQFEPEVITATP